MDGLQDKDSTGDDAGSSEIDQQRNVAENRYGSEFRSGVSGVRCAGCDAMSG